MYRAVQAPLRGRWFAFGVAAVLVGGVAAQAVDTLSVQSGPYSLSSVIVKNQLYYQPFNTDTANKAATLAAYPDVTFTNGAALSVTGGVVTGDNGNFTINAAPFTAPYYFAADVTYAGNTSSGCCNVGLQIGTNRIVFHPGFSGGGAFRVDGPGGFGNQNMGFVPANNVLHHIEVEALPGGIFNLTFTDGANPLNVYMNTFTNPANTGAPLGITGQGAATIMFDNLEVFNFIEVPLAPEPGSLALFGCAAAGLLAWRQVRRRKDRG